MSKNDNKSIQFTLLENWDDFELIKKDWNTLLGQSDADNIFLTWDWINCWRKTQPSSIHPFIIIIQEEGKNIAIAPFYIQDYRLIKFISYKALRFVGDKGSGSEYANFIVKRERSEELKNLLWQYLLNTEVKKYWDFIWFTNVSAWTKGGQSLISALTSVNALHYNQRVVEFAQIPLCNYPEDILPKLSKSLRADIRRPTRRLDKVGGWTMSTCKREDEISQLLETLFSLHNKHWQSAGLGTFARRPELADFYRKFVPIALRKGWLRLLQLESEGEIQAMQLGYVYNNEFLAIQEGYNPDFIPGVGQVLRYYSLTNCQKERLNTYDFLGIYTDHKRRWLSDKKLGANLFIWRYKIKNIPFILKKIWPSGRYLKPYD